MALFPKPSINYSNLYSGTPDQSDFKISGAFLSVAYIPTDRRYAFYQLKYSISDVFNNYAALKPSNVVPKISGVDGVPAVKFVASKQTSLRTAVFGSGVLDLQGLVGVEGNQDYYLYLKCYLPVIPAYPVAIMSVGTGLYGVSLLYIPNPVDGDRLRFRHGEHTSVVDVDVSSVPAATWLGVEMKRVSGVMYLTVQTLAGFSDTQQHAVNHFWPDENKAIYLGQGEVSALAAVPAFFNTAHTHGDFTISADGLSISKPSGGYRSAHLYDVIKPNTGRWYMEFSYHDSGAAYLGVAPVGSRLDVAIGVTGWAVGSNNGNSFAQQIGGGTRWGSAFSVGGSCGIIYDSDNGTLEYLINGVSIGSPFAHGTVQGDVVFAVGTSPSGHVSVRTSPNTWLAQPSNVNAPSTSTFLNGMTYFDGYLRDFGVRNLPLPEGETPYAIRPVLHQIIKMKNVATGEVTEHSAVVLKASSDSIELTVPRVEPGPYHLTVLALGGESPVLPFTVTSLAVLNKPNDHLVEEFTDHNAVLARWMAGHKAWGGENGGVVQQNVSLNTADGEVVITANGDDYTGPVYGVSKLGESIERKTRVGGCLVSRSYFGPGEFIIEAKLPPLSGVCSAFWLFHYEEGYAGHPLFDSMVEDGLHQSGTEEAGYYLVRNHEIDIELPTALKTDPDPEMVSYTNGRFNTWHGELRNWDVVNNDVPTNDPNYSTVNDPAYWSEYTDEWVNHGVNVTDDEYHKFGIKWMLDDGAPYVEFFIDDVLVKRVESHVPFMPQRLWLGMWFPSANTHWAGRGAAWRSQYMKIRRFEYIPEATTGAIYQNQGESYPKDFFRELNGLTVANQLAQVYASAPTGESIYYTVEINSPTLNIEGHPPGKVYLIRGFDVLTAKDHQGNMIEYQPAGIAIQFPKVGEGNSTLNIAVPNVDGQVSRSLKVIKAAGDKVEVVLRLYTSSGYQSGPAAPELRLTAKSYEKKEGVITLVCGWKIEFINKKWPPRTYTAADYAGLDYL